MGEVRCRVYVRHSHSLLGCTNMDNPSVRRGWTPANGLLLVILALGFAAGEVGGFCQLKPFVSSKHIMSSARERGKLTDIVTVLNCNYCSVLYCRCYVSVVRRAGAVASVEMVKRLLRYYRCDGGFHENALFR